MIDDRGKSEFKRTDQDHIRPPSAQRMQYLLESFLDKTIRLNSFGLTIFGAKAVSTCIVVDDNSADSDNFPVISEVYAAIDSKNIFQSSKFILKFDNRPCNERSTIELINKKALRNVIDFQQDLFRENLETEAGTDEICERIINAPCVMEALNYRHDLMGIVCGISRESAVMFQRYAELRDPSLSAPGRDIARAGAIPSPGYTTAQDEMNQINKLSNVIYSSEPGQSIIRPFSYRVSVYDHEAETTLRSYAILEKEIALLYQTGELDIQALIAKLSF